ncbi:MAG: hypothetical protein WDN45_10780 [Caulobacteraceae bacterium]
MRAILGQQVSVGAAIGLAGKLVQAHGDPAPASATGDRAPSPSPSRAPSGSAAKTWPWPCRARAARRSAVWPPPSPADPGLLGLDRSLEDAVAKLKALPGVGEWTAQYIALRGMREPDAFPAADVGLMRAMADAEGVRPTAAELLERAERWRPWRAYAAQHLWSAMPTGDRAGA